MLRAATVPFRLERVDDVIDGTGVTSTTETVDGLLRLEGGVLSVQWRVSHTVETVGLSTHEVRDVAAVRDVKVPIAGLTAAAVEPRWWQLGRSMRLVLTAPDLRRFEAISGPEGLQLDHPAQLILDIRKADRLAAQEFVAELSMAVAEPEARTAPLLPGQRAAIDGHHAPAPLPAPTSDRAP